MLVSAKYKLTVSLSMIDFLKFKVKGKGPLKIDLNRQCVSMSVRKKFKKRYNKALLCHSKIIIERNLRGF